MSKRSTHSRRRGSRLSEADPSQMWDGAFDDFDESEDVGEEWAPGMEDDLDDLEDLGSDLGQLDVNGLGDEWLDGDWAGYQEDDGDYGIGTPGVIPRDRK